MSEILIETVKNSLGAFRRSLLGCKRENRDLFYSAKTLISEHGVFAFSSVDRLYRFLRGDAFAIQIGGGCQNVRRTEVCSSDNGNCENK